MTDTTPPSDYHALAAARSASSEARLAAATNGCIYYNGMPCRVCSNVARYTRSSMCVHCTRLKQNNARKKWTEMIRTAVEALEEA